MYTKFGSYDHENTEVRLAAKYAKEAVKSFEKGDIQDALTCVRLAARFESDIYYEEDVTIRKRSKAA